MSTHRDGWAAGTPSWVDLMTTDQQGAIDFYSGLFGWEVAKSGEEFGGYGMALLEGRAVAGIGQIQDGDPTPTAWTTYLATDDADKTAEAVTANGGTVLVPPTDVGEEGRMAVAQDPTGAVFGVWQSGRHRGMQAANEPGAVTWNDCMTGDADAARDFYAAVFGYTYTSMEGADYATIDGAGPGGTVGGIGTQDPAETPGVPPHWNTCFMVADTDATARAAQDAGGQILTPAFDTPFGRMCAVADPQGASFFVMSAPAADA